MDKIEFVLLPFLASLLIGTLPIAYTFFKTYIALFHSLHHFGLKARVAASNIASMELFNTKPGGMPNPYERSNIALAPLPLKKQLRILSPTSMPIPLAMPEAIRIARM